jgi:hypothetical protein
LKASGVKCQIISSGKSVRITADFSTDTLKAKKTWNEVFQELEESNFKPRLFCSAKLLFIFQGEIKTFHDERILKQFMTIKSALQNIFK